MANRGKINGYIIFHLNLAYSSIAESERKNVIRRCYWPLLELIDGGTLAALEIPAYTLEQINQLDKAWVHKFKELIKQGKTELVGSGYMQLIGPLVPSQLNDANQYWGNKIYKELLDVTPRVALVNEQTFSRGMVDIYKKAGYKAIVMDWDNPYRFNKKWNYSWQYQPQIAKGINEDLPVIWSNTVAFQKFQRVIHKEIDEEEYVNYIDKIVSEAKGGYFPVYVSDVEIFDYRPGRFHTEAPMGEHPEWQKMKNILVSLRSRGCSFILPSKVLDNIELKRARKLDLTSPEQPIPVKKQEKYTTIRWALAGRNNLLINTLCYKIFNKLQNLKLKITDNKYKELCYYWGSDFRTHIEESRWKKYLTDLQKYAGEF